MQLDLTQELAQLIGHMTNVSAAIRLHSAYSEGDPYRVICPPGCSAPRMPEARKQSLNDLMWLSDSIMKLGELSRAISNCSIDPIIQACDKLQSIYQMYIEGTNRFKSNPKETFDLHGEYINLEEPKAIFGSIRNKALGVKAAAASRGANFGAEAESCANLTAIDHKEEI